MILAADAWSPRSRTFLALALAAAVGLMSPAARADDFATVEAERRFQEGIERFNAQNYEGAALAFEEAWALSKQERFLWNLAVSELNERVWVKAYRHLSDCAHAAGVSADHAQQIARAEGFVRPHVLLLKITAPDGAAIEVDGVSVGQAPLGDAIAVDPVTVHQITASFGDTRVEQSAHGAPGEAEVRLSLPAPAPMPEAGPLSAAPIPERRAAQGDHNQVARFAASGTIAGLGLASGAIALGFYLDSRSQWNTIETLLPEVEAAQPTRPPGTYCVGVMSTACTSLNAANLTYVRDENLALGFAITGGGLLVAGTALYFLWPTAARSTAGTFVPFIGERRVGGLLSFRLPQ